MTLERDDFATRLTERYAEQYAGLRQQLAAVDRNVMKFIAEGRDRGEQIDVALKQLVVCANELRAIKTWARSSTFIGVSAILLLGVGVVALLIEVF